MFRRLGIGDFSEVLVRDVYAKNNIGKDEVIVLACNNGSRIPVTLDEYANVSFREACKSAVANSGVKNSNGVALDPTESYFVHHCEICSSALAERLAVRKNMF